MYLVILKRFVNLFILKRFVYLAILKKRVYLVILKKFVCVPCNFEAGINDLVHEVEGFVASVVQRVRTGI